MQYISRETHEALRRSILRGGDILFSIAGALGRVAMVTEEILPANTNQALAIIRLKQNGTHLQYMKYLLESDFIQRQVKRVAIQLAQANINLEHIADFIVKLPPLNEQNKIANILAAIDQHIENNIAIEKKLCLLKNGLMRYLMTGELRTQA
jgi:type I restriction enzyme S subunit